MEVLFISEKVKESDMYEDCLKSDEEDEAMEFEDEDECTRKIPDGLEP